MTGDPQQASLFEPPQDFTDEIPFDRWYLDRGFRLLAGVDEAGRGALAGPVCAAAVILGDTEIDGLDDSKKLKPETREALYDQIWEQAKGVGVALVGSGRIDTLNILWAAMEAMELAVGMLPVTPELVLVDGDRVPAGLDRAVAVVKGDTKSQCIMAASIIAKVTRDRYMYRKAGEFPEYGFEKHVGYSVPVHFKAIKEHGPTAIHRMTFAPCQAASRGLPGGKGTGTMARPVLRERSK